MGGERGPEREVADSTRGGGGAEEGEEGATLTVRWARANVALAERWGRDDFCLQARHRLPFGFGGHASVSLRRRHTRDAASP